MHAGLGGGTALSSRALIDRLKQREEVGLDGEGDGGGGGGGGGEDPTLGLTRDLVRFFRDRNGRAKTEDILGDFGRFEDARLFKIVLKGIATRKGNTWTWKMDMDM